MGVSLYGVIIGTMFFLSRRFASLLNPGGGCTIFGISSAAVNLEARLSALWSRSFSSSKRSACWMWRCFDLSRSTSNPKFNLWLIASNKLMCSLQASRSTGATERLSFKFFSCCWCCENIDSHLDWIGWTARSICILFICSVREFKDIPKFWGSAFWWYCWSRPLGPWGCWSRCVLAFCWFCQLIRLNTLLACSQFCCLRAFWNQCCCASFCTSAWFIRCLLNRSPMWCPCWRCFSIAVLPVGLAIISEVGIVVEVPVTISMVSVFFLIIKDRHGGNVGFIRSMVLPKCKFGPFIKLYLRTCVIPQGDSFLRYFLEVTFSFCFSLRRLWPLWFVPLQWLS